MPCLRQALDSEHLHDFVDLRNGFTQLALDAHFQGHGAAGAGATGTLKANLDNRPIDFDDLNVAAIGHQIGAQLIEGALDVFQGEGARITRLRGGCGLSAGRAFDRSCLGGCHRRPCVCNQCRKGPAALVVGVAEDILRQAQGLGLEGPPSPWLSG